MAFYCSQNDRVAAIDSAAMVFGRHHQFVCKNVYGYVYVCMYMLRGAFAICISFPTTDERN